ncbi:translation initiation factor IF-2 [Mesoaciditoga lauensis]|uniref:translation initiation factor IF-2 n=1 Tax=Mesoaciditoga lauensis TaxID=1495039 RepID=UPI000568FFD6|nr:translation initiation factor IF-2 [Mesoaciditoga lauensis]
MEKKIRVYELAKRLKMSSKELLEELEDLGVSAKNHMSTLDSSTVDMLMEIYSSEEVEEEEVKVKKVAPKKSQPKIEEEEEEEIEAEKPKESEIEVSESMTLRELCEKMGISTSKVIKDLFMEGKALTINTVLDEEAIKEIAQKYSIHVNFVAPKKQKISDPLKEEFEQLYIQKKNELVLRPPVVTIMGHVDHGKTTLLDKIRKTRVAEKEVGGITQSIGAYKVKIDGKSITFIDTPGHEAFTEMRARGAQATDVVVLVVAADDGVMPQTIEAYDHAKTAGVPVVVAINKIDKPNANVELVKQELVNKLNIVPDDWGGDTPIVPISAKAGIGIDELLEMILLVAELREIKCFPKGKARGVIIESKLDKFRGPVATVIVKDGILRLGDYFVAGKTYGKVKSLLDESGKRIKEAHPSDPVVVLGFEEVPDANSMLYVVADQKEAKKYAEEYAQSMKEKPKHVRLDNIYELSQTEGQKILNLIIKADTFGTLGALKTAVQKIEPEEIKIEVIHAGIGNVNINDVLLASATQGVILGFRVGSEPRTKAKAEQLGVQIRTYDVIFELLDDIKAALSGMMEPEIVEEVTGHARVLQVFNISKTGKIAGFQLYDGSVERNCKVRVYRNKELIFDGTIETLKHFKDDVDHLEAPQEGGLKLEGFEGFESGDEIEFYLLKEIKKAPTYKKTN